MANITIKDIIRAIDIIICRNCLFTDEQLASVFNNNNYIAKAAQAVMKTKNTKPENIENNKRMFSSVEDYVLNLLQRGFQIKEITRFLRTNEEYIRDIAKKYKLHTPSLRNQWYQDTYESPVREMTNKIVDNPIRVVDIAKELNVSQKMVATVIKTAGISLSKLVDDRRDKQIEQLKIVVSELEMKGGKITDRSMAAAYWDKYKIRLPISTIRRIFVNGNITSPNVKKKKDNLIDSIDHWIWKNSEGGVDSFIARNTKNRNEIYNLIDIIFNQLMAKFGKHFGLNTAQDADHQEIKRLIMSRLQAKNLIADRDVLRKQEDFKNNEQYKNLQEYRVDPKITVDQFKKKYKPINPKIRPNFEKELIKEKERRQMANKSNNWYKLAKEYNKLPGGRGEGKHPSDFPKDQVNKGIEIELEHGPDKDQATEIALDHLTEFDDYYTGLDEMEKRLKEKHKK